MGKRSKYTHTDSYFYLARHLTKCMMRFDMHVCPVRTKMTNIQKMNNSDMITQNIPYLHVCSSDEIKLKLFI